ncbi:MAG TPA: sortase [Nocardioidaceae bacterium]|nr:sortase [Nocardioidaceae bacterium]
MRRAGGGERKPPPPARPATSVSSQLLGSVGTLVALMLLTFVAEMALVGPVRHARQQNVLYQELRATMAAGTTPTGQLDFEGNPVQFGTPVGLLSIPSLGIREVMLEGTTSGVLMDGIGHRRDTPMPGQPGVSLVMGRQAAYGGPFGNLADIELDSEIAVRTAQGPMLFRVTAVRYPGDPQLPPDPEVASLTLITATGTPFLPEDVVRIDAVLDEEFEVLPAPTRVYGTSTLVDAEQSMAGDLRTLLPLLLWSQLLLILAALLAWVRTVWGRWQSWIVVVPVMSAVGLQVSHLVAQLLPNLL